MAVRNAFMNARAKRRAYRGLSPLVAFVACSRSRPRAIRAGLGLQPAGRLAERGPELHPSPPQALADVLRALAQRLGALPHLARSLGRALAHIGEGILSLVRRWSAHLLDLELPLFAETLGAMFHLFKTGFETAHELRTERRRVGLQFGELPPQGVEIALELRPLLVRLGLAFRRLSAKFRSMLVFHLSPHSVETGPKENSGAALWRVQPVRVSEASLSVGLTAGFKRRFARTKSWVLCLPRSRGPKAGPSGKGRALATRYAVQAEASPPAAREAIPPDCACPKAAYPPPSPSVMPPCRLPSGQGSLACLRPKALLRRGPPRACGRPTLGRASLDQDRGLCVSSAHRSIRQTPHGSVSFGMAITGRRRILLQAVLLRPSPSAPVSSGSRPSMVASRFRARLTRLLIVPTAQPEISAASS